MAHLPCEGLKQEIDHEMGEAALAGCPANIWGRGSAPASAPYLSSFARTPACAPARMGLRGRDQLAVAVFARHLGLGLELVLEVHGDGGFGSLEEVRDSDQRCVDAIEREPADAG